jgi:hypothetical protein
MRTVTFNHPFRETLGLAEATEATSIYQIAIAGRGYVLDTRDEEFRWQSMEALRPQQDDGDEPGPGSLSSLDLWRRSTRSWHLGAGQIRADEEGASTFRFLTSEGVDPWTRYQLSLLNKTSVVEAGGTGKTSVVLVDGRLIQQSDTLLSRSFDGVTWDALTTLSATPTTQMVTDGADLYVGLGSGIIGKVTSVGIQSTAFTLADTQVLAFSKGRLWAGANNVLHYMTPGSSPTAHLTVPWTGWRWTAISEGSRATYAAGFLGDKSSIYRIPIKADGTGLDAGVVAASLPDGEVCYSLLSYLGYLMIGTNKGVRFAVPNDEGDLAYGALIPTDSPVRCFEAQDRFVWFGWSDFSDTQTGLGRVDLSQFTSELTPAYASDLMYLGQGEVTSAVTLGDKRLFTVAGVGVIAEGSGPVASGSVTLSDFTYGLDDNKILSLIDLRHYPLDGTISVAVGVDDTGIGVVGESSSQGSVAPPSKISINPITGQRFAVRVTLTPSPDDLGPILRSVMLLAHPTPPRGEQFFLPLLIHEQIDHEGTYLEFKPPEEVQFLRSLVKKGAPVTLQIGNEAFSAFPANYRWVPYRQMNNKTGWSGTCVMELREVTQ